MQLLKKLVRGILARAGFVLWKRDSIRYGVDPHLDIVRLSRKMGLPIRTVFDVGANIGVFYREVIAAVPDATVYAFEPHPTTYARLAEAVFAPSRPYQLALGSRCGMVPFYVYGDDGVGCLLNSLTPDAIYTRRGGWQSDVIEVESMTLDAFCEREGIQRIDLLKIDAEGFDLAVLQGGARIFSEQRVTFVLVEFNNLLDKGGKDGGDLVPIANYLATHGLTYLISYTDSVLIDDPVCIVSNALFVRSAAVPAQS